MNCYFIQMYFYVLKHSVGNFRQFLKKDRKRLLLQFSLNKLRVFPLILNKCGLYGNRDANESVTQRLKNSLKINDFSHS